MSLFTQTLSNRTERKTKIIQKKQMKSVVSFVNFYLIVNRFCVEVEATQICKCCATSFTSNVISNFCFSLSQLMASYADYFGEMNDWQMKARKKKNRERKTKWFRCDFVFIFHLDDITRHFIFIDLHHFHRWIFCLHIDDDGAVCADIKNHLKYLSPFRYWDDELNILLVRSSSGEQWNRSQWWSGTCSAHMSTNTLSVSTFARHQANRIIRQINEKKRKIWICCFFTISIQTSNELFVIKFFFLFSFAGSFVLQRHSMDF